MKIRAVRESDANAIAAIYEHYVLHTAISFEIEAVSAEEMLERITTISAKFPYLVCEDEAGNLLGYCYVHEWKDRLAYAQTLEVTIYLKQDICGKQLGECLMRKLIDECKANGYAVLVACITAENTISRRFFEKLGFRQVSCFKEVGYKFGRYLDVTDYQLTIK